MANNRLWLVHRPSGAAVFLGKRMGVGWYGAPDNLTERMEAFYESIDDNALTQDDFVLAIEDASQAPSCTDKWRYGDNHKPKLQEE